MAEPKRTIPRSPPPLAVGLVRCSTDHQEHSTQDQETEIRAWADETGHRLGPIFGDEGISGSELDRPGVRALLAYLESSPEKGTVVCWKRNRLARPDDPRDGLLLERRIEQTGWRLHFLQGTQASGNQLVDTMLGVLEHYQGGQFLRDLSINSIRGQLHRILAGDVPGGAVPYGYEKVIVGPDGKERRVGRRTKHRKIQEERARWVPGDPIEVRTVRRIFTRYASEEVGLATLAKELNDEQIPSPGGSRWCLGTVRDLLRNPIYAGDLVWNRETVGLFSRVSGGKPQSKEKASKGRAKNAPTEWILLKDHHEPLVDRALFDRASAVVQDRAEKRGGQRNVKLAFPLTGVLFCAQCGARMNGCTSTYHGKQYIKYSCNSRRTTATCECYAVGARGLEAAVLRKLKEVYLPQVDHDRLRGKVLAALRKQVHSGVPADQKGLRRERQRVQTQIETAVENMGVVSKDVARQVASRIEGWTARIAEIDAALAKAEVEETKTSSLEATADQVMDLLTSLDETTDDTPTGKKRKLFLRAVDRLELQFESRPPKRQDGRKRHTFLGGHLIPVPLLDVALRAAAGAARCAQPMSEEALRAASGGRYASGWPSISQRKIGRPSALAFARAAQGSVSQPRRDQASSDSSGAIDAWRSSSGGRSSARATASAATSASSAPVRARTRGPTRPSSGAGRGCRTAARPS